MRNSSLPNSGESASALGLKGEGIPSLERVLEMLPDLLEPHYNPSTWAQDIEQRISAYRLGQ